MHPDDPTKFLPPILGTGMQSMWQGDETRAMSDVLLGPSVDGVDIDGLDLDAAAAQLGIGIDDLWRRVRNGQLIARTSRGKVFVYASDTGSRFDIPLVQTAEQSMDLPKAIQARENPNMDLWIDHLSLAKDENREILRFTQDSMRRLSDLTDDLVRMKNEVIAARERDVAHLTQQLARQDEELRKVLREKENLETLARALTSSP